MIECKFCKNIIEDKDKFCKYCGYDPKTDSVNKDFIPSIKPIKRRERFKTVPYKVGVFSVGISPGVKKFAFIGLAILIFSIFYKNNFNVSNVFSEVKYLCSNIVSGKFSVLDPRKKKDNKRVGKKIEWIDVRTFQEGEK